MPLILLTGAALIFLSIMAQIGVGPIHLFRQFEMREAMERRILKGLPDEALSVLRFTTLEFEEVSLYDGGLEMEVDDQLYDIVSVERNAGSVIVKAVRDGDETRLNADLDRMVRSLLAQDQQGKHERASVVASWAPYCEAWSPISIVPKNRTTQDVPPPLQGYFFGILPP